MNTKRTCKKLARQGTALGYTDLRLTQCGHLRFVHETGRFVIISANSKGRSEQNARAELKRHSRRWQQQSPSSSSAPPGART